MAFWVMIVADWDFIVGIVHSNRGSLSIPTTNVLCTPITGAVGS